MMPPLDEVGATPAPGKLKKHPGAGPLGHNDGLMMEFGLDIMLLFYRLEYQLSNLLLRKDYLTDKEV